MAYRDEGHQEDLAYLVSETDLVYSYHRERDWEYHHVAVVVEGLDSYEGE